MCTHDNKNCINDKFITLKIRYVLTGRCKYTKCVQIAPCCLCIIFLSNDFVNILRFKSKWTHFPNGAANKFIK